MHPTWKHVEESAQYLVLGLETISKTNDGWQPDYIIGLTRGGLIPAVLISHILDVPMIAVNYSSAVGAGDNKNHQNALPAIYGGTVSGTGELPAAPNLLIVDDICDSGHTLKEVYEFYANQGHNVHTAVMYYKEGGVFTPTLWWHWLPKDAPWIIFSWEN